MMRRAGPQLEAAAASARWPALAAAAGLVAVAFMGSTVITPLYVLYQHRFGFSEITLTLVYAVYVVGNLLALMVFGRLSDQIGRRPVGLGAIAIAGLAAMLFLAADGTAWIFGGRVLSGLAVGLASGTGTAWLAELFGPRQRPLATLTASCANLVGIAIGPLLAGLLAQYAPWPESLCYLAYLAILGGAAVLVALAQETVQDRAHRLGDISFRPRLGLPGKTRAQFVAPAITAFGTFALVGFYAALIPSILAGRLAIANRAVSGAVVCELFVVATLAMLATRRVPSRAAMTGGLVLLLAALLLLVLAQWFASLPLLLVATAGAGISAALGYRGSLEIINEIAPAERRAEVVSAYYICSFIGNSLPVIGVGVVTVLAGAMAASIAFAATIAVFTIFALARGAGARPGGERA
jgi:MFS family permease